MRILNDLKEMFTRPGRPKIWLLLGIVGWWLGGLASPVLADGFILRASVPAVPSDFQLELRSSQTKPAPPNTQILYTITYGWLVPYPTDIMVIQVQWSQVQWNEQQADLLSYVAGSASPAGQFAPQIDPANRTITWNISPVTPGANQQVHFGLRTGSLSSQDILPFTIQTRIIGPGITLPWQVLDQQYQFTTPATVSPSPPNGGHITPPTPKPSSGLPPVAQQTNRWREIARHGGGAASAPLLALALWPWLLTLLTTIAAILPNLRWWQLLSLMGVLFWRRPKRSWGVVYDAKTKLPLEPVLLTLTNQYGQTFQTISDPYGRYEFAVDPGEYKLEATMEDYTFPSKVLQQSTFDEVYQDLYHGQAIIIHPGDHISYNLPMDPLTADWQKTPANSTYWPQVSTYAFSVGFAWSLAMAGLYPGLINLSVVGMYVVCLVLTYVYRSQHPWGVVTNSHHQPVAGAVITLDDVANPQIVYSPVVTTKNGRYVFSAHRGIYQLQVALRRTGGRLWPVTSATVQQKKLEGHIAQDITLPAHKSI